MEGKSGEYISFHDFYNKKMLNLIHLNNNSSSRNNNINNRVYTFLVTEAGKGGGN